MSLVKGGVFDLGPAYENGSWWNPPHSEHRVGTNCDLSNAETYTSAQQAELADIISNYGSYLDEGNHWHLRL